MMWGYYNNMMGGFNNYNIGGVIFVGIVMLYIAVLAIWVKDQTQRKS